MFCSVTLDFGMCLIATVLSVISYILGAAMVGCSGTMDWVQEHCDGLKCKLQAVIDGGGASEKRKEHLRVPWSWVCR